MATDNGIGVIYRKMMGCCIRGTVGETEFCFSTEVKRIESIKSITKSNKCNCIATVETLTEKAKKTNADLVFDLFSLVGRIFTMHGQKWLRIFF